MAIKFKNPETGEVLTLTSDDVFNKFCGAQDCCAECPLGSFPGTWEDCETWMWNNIEKAAEVVGLEVVREEEKTLVETQDEETGDLIYAVKEEESMDMNNGKPNNSKPKICEILGVEVGEEFKIKGLDETVFQILDDGTFTAQPFNVPGSTTVLLRSTTVLLRALDHPERIVHLPRWSPDEVTLAKMFWDACYNMADVFFSRGNDGRLSWGVNSDSMPPEENYLPVCLFPHIKNGQKVYLRDIVG